MANYINETCMACGESFKEGEDIVVCPECGTPLHRECYNKYNRCVNLELHRTGGTWQHKVNIPTHKQKGNKNANVNQELTCPQCGMKNSPGSKFCVGCGNELPNDERRWNSGFFSEKAKDIFPERNIFVNIGGENVKIDFDDPNGGMNPNDDFDGAKLENVSEFVGNQNSASVSWLILFKRFKSKGLKISSNIACLFFPYIYFAYRKMWAACFSIIAILLLLSIPSLLYSIATLDISYYESLFAAQGLSDQATNIMRDWQELLEPYLVVINNLSVISTAIKWAIHILLFLFANYLYYKFTVKRVNDIQDEYVGTNEDVKGICRAEGGTSVGSAILGFIIKTVAEFLLTAIIFVILLTIIN